MNGGRNKQEDLGQSVITHASTSLAQPQPAMRLLTQSVSQPRESSGYPHPTLRTRTEPTPLTSSKKKSWWGGKEISFALAPPERSGHSGQRSHAAIRRAPMASTPAAATPGSRAPGLVGVACEGSPLLLFHAGCASFSTAPISTPVAAPNAAYGDGKESGPASGCMTTYRHSVSVRRMPLGSVTKHPGVANVLQESRPRLPPTANCQLPRPRALRPPAALSFAPHALPVGAARRYDCHSARSPSPASGMADLESAAHCNREPPLAGCGSPQLSTPLVSISCTVWPWARRQGLFAPSRRPTVHVALSGPACWAPGSTLDFPA